MVTELRGSVYRLCSAPKRDQTVLFFRNPQGTLKVERRTTLWLLWTSPMPRPPERASVAPEYQLFARKDSELTVDSYGVLPVRVVIRIVILE